MALTARVVTIDRADSKALAGLWSEVLRYEQIAQLVRFGTRPRDEGSTRAVPAVPAARNGHGICVWGLSG